MKAAQIRDADLLIRPWKPADAEAVYQACQDPEIQRWLRVPRPYEREHAEEFVGVVSPKAWSEGTGAYFGVFDSEDGTLLGAVGLMGITRKPPSAEIGYWTAPWARGRGVASRAARAVARWGFTELGLSRVTWQADLGNHRSRLTALRAGFRVEGRLRVAEPGASGHEAWVGSLLPSDLETEPEPPSETEVRRAKVFSGEQPELSATTPSGTITLRRPTEEDIDAIIASCRDDPILQKWTSLPDSYGRSHAEFFIRNLVQEGWAAGTAARYGIYDPHGEYVGSVELRISQTDPAIADVGYLVAKAARGRGYATAALRALCAWGFEALDLARIEWRAHVGNEASRRVAEKAGFTMEGVQRAGIAHRGERRDCWLGSLLPSDLKQD